MSAGTAPAVRPARDPDDGHGVRMPTFSDDSTSEQLAAGVVMMLGFLLSAGVVLGAYAGLLSIMRR